MSSSGFVEASIRSLPMFARLPPEQIATLARYFQTLRVEAGQAIFTQGQPSRGLYFFLNGSGHLIQRTPDGAERQLAVVQANQYLNDAALIRPHTEAATLRALETSIVLLLERSHLLQALSDHPELHPYLPTTLVPPAPATPNPRATPPPMTRPAAVPQRSPGPLTTPAVAPVTPARNMPAPAPQAPPSAPVSAATNAPSAGKLFREQRDDEVVLLDTRRHWWAFVGRSWLSGVVMIVVVFLALLAPTWEFGLLLGSIGLTVPGLLLIYFYLEWRNDHILVTDQRIIHIERILSRLQTVISEVPIASVQEVNAIIVTSDLFSRVFGYGTVEIRTPGEAGNLVLTMIPDPQGVQKLIFAHRDRVRQEAALDQRNVIRAEIGQIIGGASPAPRSQGSGDLELIYRKHFVYRARTLFLPVLLLIAAFLLMILSLASPALRANPLVPLLGLLLFVIGGAWAYWNDWDWRNDMYIVGSEVIQLIHKRPLWLQNESEQVSIAKIDSIISDQNGLLQTIFNYGDVRISLLGGDVGSEKVFRSVPEPDEVQAEIARRQEARRSFAAADAERRRRSEIAEYLSAYHQTVSGSAPENAPPATPSTAAPPATAPAQPPRRILPTQPGTEPPITQVRDRLRPPNIPRSGGAVPRDPGKRDGQG
ncbi:MAG: cyclic nucleotide-binding domain-containing protein [bacterium]|nr:cyclic nucleotide-binding domain-containing protein [bacterium]